MWPATTRAAWSERSASLPDRAGPLRRAIVPVAEALGIGVVGLLHAAAAGAVILAGLNLAIPGLVEAGSPAEAAAAAVALGLGCLGVLLESSDLQGTFAPLTGLLVTIWGLHSAVRRTAALTEAGRGWAVAGTAGGFAAACAGAAVLAGASSTVRPSVSTAAVAGLLWGAVAGAWATRPPHSAENGPPAYAWARPGIATAVVAAGVAGIWLLGLLGLRIAGLPAREVAGVLILAVAAAPNALVALIVVGLGGSVDIALTGTALADRVTESLSLWDWRGSGAAPLHVWALALSPLAGAVAGARGDARGNVVVRGFRNGAVFGGIVVLLGWAGSFGVAAAAAGERVSLRLGFAWAAAFGLAVAWGVAGAVLARLPWPGRSGRAPKVTNP